MKNFGDKKYHREKLLSTFKKGFLNSFFAANPSLDFLLIRLDNPKFSIQRLIPFVNEDCNFSPICLYDIDEVISLLEEKDKSPKKLCHFCNELIRINKFYGVEEIAEKIDHIWQKFNLEKELICKTFKIMKNGTYKVIFDVIHHNGLPVLKETWKYGQVPDIKEYNKEELKYLIKDYFDENNSSINAFGNQIRKMDLIQLYKNADLNENLICIFCHYMEIYQKQRSLVYNTKYKNLHYFMVIKLKTLQGKEIYHLKDFKIQNLFPLEKNKVNLKTLMKHFRGILIILQYENRWFLGCYLISEKNIFIWDFLDKKLTDVNNEEMDVIFELSLKKQVSIDIEIQKFVHISCKNFKFYSSKSLEVMSLVYSIFIEADVNPEYIIFQESKLKEFSRKFLWVCLKLPTIYQEKVKFFQFPDQLVEKTPANSKKLQKKKIQSTSTENSRSIDNSNLISYKKSNIFIGRLHNKKEESVISSVSSLLKLNLETRKSSLNVNNNIFIPLNEIENENENENESESESESENIDDDDNEAQKNYKKKVLKLLIPNKSEEKSKYELEESSEATNRNKTEETTYKNSLSSLNKQKNFVFPEVKKSKDLFAVTFQEKDEKIPDLINSPNNPNAITTESSHKKSAFKAHNKIIKPMEPVQKFNGNFPAILELKNLEKNSKKNKYINMIDTIVDNDDEKSETNKKKKNYDIQNSIKRKKTNSFQIESLNLKKLRKNKEYNPSKQLKIDDLNFKPFNEQKLKSTQNKEHNSNFKENPIFSKNKANTSKNEFSDKKFTKLDSEIFSEPLASKMSRSLIIDLLKEAVKADIKKKLTKEINQELFQMEENINMLNYLELMEKSKSEYELSTIPTWAHHR